VVARPIVVIAAVALLSGCGADRPGSTVSSTTGSASETLTESVELDDTSGVWCTASISSTLEPAAAAGVRFTLENRSSSPQDVSTFPPAFPVKITDGEGTVWDTGDLMAHSWPMMPPVSLAPGGTTKVDPEGFRVQFPGPLRVVPTCAGQAMDPFTVSVAGGGPALDEEDAVRRAAEAGQGLLSGCTQPAVDGGSTYTVASPEEAGGALEVRCAVGVGMYDGFSVVTFTLVAPSDAAIPSIPEGPLVGVPIAGGAEGSAETIVWRFVVTTSDAGPVASATASHTVPAGDRMAVSYDVSARGWTAGDRSRCGGESYSTGGDGRTVNVVFLDTCPAST
jgi:hypothetical protein